MPVYEYRCESCNKKFDMLHKSSMATEEVVCPNCGSTKNKKLFSSFAAKADSHPDFGGCSDGSCPANTPPSAGGCCCGGACSHN
jgi:putative FmdB family regulatory protein